MKRVYLMNKKEYLLTDKEFAKLLSDNEAGKRMSYCARLEAFIGLSSIVNAETPREELGRDVYVSPDEKGYLTTYIRSKKGTFYQLLGPNGPSDFMKVNLDKDGNLPSWLTKNLYKQEEFINAEGEDGALPETYAQKLLKEKN